MSPKWDGGISGNNKGRWDGGFTSSRKKGKNRGGILGRGLGMVKRSSKRKKDNLNFSFGSRIRPKGYKRMDGFVNSIKYTYARIERQEAEDIDRLDRIDDLKTEYLRQGLKNDDADRLARVTVDDEIRKDARKEARLEVARRGLGSVASSIDGFLKRLLRS